MAELKTPLNNYKDSSHQIFQDINMKDSPVDQMLKMKLELAQKLDYMHLTFNFFKGDSKTGINGYFFVVVFCLLANLYFLVKATTQNIRDMSDPNLLFYLGLFTVSTLTAFSFSFKLLYQTRTLQLFLTSDSIKIVYKYGPKEKAHEVNLFSLQLMDVVWLQERQWVVLVFDDQETEPVFLKYKGAPDGKAYMFLVDQFCFKGKASRDAAVLMRHPKFAQALATKMWPPLNNWLQLYQKHTQNAIFYVFLNWLVMYLF